MFLDGSLPCLTKLNLSLQRADPFIHVLHDLLHSTVVVLMSLSCCESLYEIFEKKIYQNKIFWKS